MELYLHGLSKGDFELALRGLLGDSVPLSRTTFSGYIYNGVNMLIENEKKKERLLKGSPHEKKIYTLFDTNSYSSCIFCR